MKLSSFLLPSWSRHIFGEDIHPGALRTKNTHGTKVVPRRFRPTDQRFWGRHRTLRNAFVALTTFIIVSSAQQNAVFAQPDTKSRDFRRALDLGSQVWTLPNRRWSGEMTLRTDLGVTSGILPFTTAFSIIAGFLIGMANFGWMIITGLFNITFNMDWVTNAGDEINEITASLGGWLIQSGIVFIIAIAVIVTTVMQSLKGASTSVFKTLISAIIPLGLVFFMVNAAITANANQERLDNGGFKTLGSPGWLLYNGIKISSISTQVLESDFAGGASISSLTFDSDTLITDDNKSFAACKDYVEAIHSEANAIGNLLGNESGILVDQMISALWERSVLMPWIHAQYGSKSDIGVRAFCHQLEEESDAPAVVRWHLMKKAYPGIAQRVPGGKNTQRGSWKQVPGDNDYYAPGAQVVHINNHCSPIPTTTDPRITAVGFYDGSGNPLQKVLDPDLQQETKCDAGQIPERLLLHFNPPDKDDEEANWTAWAWCKWKKNVPPSEVFADPGNTEFTNVWKREDEGGKRKDIGVNEYQSCNQWLDFGHFAPRTTKLSDGIFKFLRLDIIITSTVQNNVNSNEVRGFLFALNGHGGIQTLLLGFFAWMTSFFYGFALIGLGLYVFLAQLQLFLALALFPLFLMAGAIPHPKAKALSKGGFKMILLGLFAKALATGLLVALFFLIAVLTKLFTTLNLGGGTIGSLYSALIPVVALFAIRRIPGVKDMTTIRGAYKGTKQRIARTMKADGGISAAPKQRGFIGNAARQSARSFGHGMIGASPYAARKLGANVRNGAFNWVRGRKGAKGERTKEETARDSADTVRGKENKAPPPPPDQPQPHTDKPPPPDPTRPDRNTPDQPSYQQSFDDLDPSFSGGGSGNKKKKSRGWSRLPNGLEVPNSYFDDENGKPKGDTRAPTQDEIERKKEQVDTANRKTREAVDPSKSWDGHQQSFDDLEKTFKETANPDTVRPSGPSATEHAPTSASQYADVAGGAGHQDAGQSPAAPQTVYSTVDQTGDQSRRQNAFDMTADAITASTGMGGGMFFPGQQQQQQSQQPIFVGAPGQSFNSMLEQTAAADMAAAAAAANARAAAALQDAAKKIETTVDRSMQTQQNITRQGVESQMKSTDKIGQSIKDIPRSKD
jgi:hypothetical protein